MGKQGPCYHCGVTTTPLWRNGPPEKPVLCNACGSRWRTKGTLTNYTPLHARAEPTDSENYRKVCAVKPIIIKTKERKLQKRKLLNDNAELSGEAPIFDQNFRRVYEEDTNNRSSSGSATSYSESCVHVGSTDASDLTGTAQSIVWDSLVPSRKRTCVGRPKSSSVEKLTKDLYSILHQQQSSCLTGSLEEDLLFETGTLMNSVEIGHGGVLIKHLNVVAQDEESEASSFPIHSKEYITNDTYSRSAFLPAPIANKGISSPKIGNEKVKRFAATGPQEAAQEHTKRDKFSHDKVHILQNRNSPLTSIDLIDVVCFEKFVRNLSPEEQQHLMKLLPSIDTVKLPNSLKSMFDSPQFMEALSSFQHLLLEGIFDLSFSEVKIEECRTVKRLALVNMTKSKWVEHYELLKDVKGKTIAGKGVETEINSPSCSNSASIKRTHDGQNQNFPETKCLVKGPKRVHYCTMANVPFIRPPQPNSNYVGTEASLDVKYVDNEGSCCSPISLFAFPPDGSSVTLDSLQFTDDNQDLLFDVPSYASFPEAELLDYHPLKQKNPPKGSLIENRNVEKEETLSTYPSSSFIG
eukprot:TRINITY_DN2694_c0_g1_i2.p1 TRINITY_DN2694_c0_g1~~TRINITY_DN2694_c0_g1_i2.p1  ORF type:complete len:579 (-),score=106.29 TRINITY_DN2694_c0_g1_i2:634-2370(-)